MQLTNQMDRFLAKFINLNFYLSLVPFRVELLKSRNTYGETVLHYELVLGSTVQRLIAGTILGLDILQGVFLTRGAYWGKIIRYPSVLFLIWKTIHNSLILGLLWAWTFWKRGRHSDFHKILRYLLNNRRFIHALDKGNSSASNHHNHEDDETEGNSKENWRVDAIMWTFLVSFGLLFPIGVELLRIFNIDGEARLENPEDNFRISSAQILFDLCLVKNHTHISHEAFSTAYSSISIVYMIIRTWGKVLLGMGHILTFLSAIIFYTEVRRLCRLAFSTQHNLKYLIQQYLRFRRLVNLLNNVNRPILLCLVSASVPLFVLRLIDAWDSNQISIKFIILVKIVQFLVIVIISAEANDKAIVLKSQMLELCQQEQEGRVWAGHIFRENLGLESGRFVKISFSFIGSMFSAYLSYAIMLLQISPC